MDKNKQQLAVSVHQVSKQFQQGSEKIHALKEINFEAYTNELLLIVGPSGCGKTTLLSVIAGPLHFDTGEINVFNTPLHTLTESKITKFRRKNVGFIFQQYHLIQTLNCLENVCIPLFLNGIKRSEAEQLAAHALEKVGLKGREKSKPQNLSGGQQQRVTIARALVHNPRLVICDEPTAALDAETGSSIMELLIDISKNSEHCVIVVTHDNRIFKYADRIARMDDGKIISTNETNQY